MRHERRLIPGAVLALKRDKGHSLFPFANAKEMQYSHVINRKFGAYSEPGVNEFSAPILLPFILKFLKQPNKNTKGCAFDVLRWLRICGGLKYRFRFTTRRIRSR